MDYNVCTIIVWYFEVEIVLLLHPSGYKEMWEGAHPPKYYIIYFMKMKEKNEHLPKW